jgi:hypothetical protein
MRVRTHIKAGGNGVANEGPTPHFEGSTLVGYFFWYHDQQVTGNDRKWSVQMSVADYAALRAAALSGPTEFAAEWNAGVWKDFSDLYTGISLAAARAGVQLVLTPP